MTRKRPIYTMKQCELTPYNLSFLYSLMIYQPEFTLIKWHHVLYFFQITYATFDLLENEKTFRQWFSACVITIVFMSLLW